MSLSRDSMCSYSSEIISSLSVVNYFVWKLLKNYFPQWKMWMKTRTFWSEIKILSRKLLVFCFFSFSPTAQSILLKVLSSGFPVKSIRFLSCFALSPKESRCPPWTNFCYVKINFVLASGLTTAWVSLLQQLTNTPKHLISLTDTVIF